MLLPYHSIVYCQKKNQQIYKKMCTYILDSKWSKSFKVYNSSWAIQPNRGKQLYMTTQVPWSAESLLNTLKNITYGAPLIMWAWIPTVQWCGCHCTRELQANFEEQDKCSNELVFGIFPWALLFFPSKHWQSAHWWEGESPMQNNRWACSKFSSWVYHLHDCRIRYTMAQQTNDFGYVSWIHLTIMHNN